MDKILHPIHPHPTYLKDCNWFRIHPPPPKTNMEPENKAFQVRNLLFQGSFFFRFSLLVLRGGVFTSSISSHLLTRILSELLAEIQKPLRMKNIPLSIVFYTSQVVFSPDFERTIINSTTQNREIRSLSSPPPLTSSVEAARPSATPRPGWGFEFTHSKWHFL